jgi:hypothetical protein
MMKKTILSLAICFSLFLPLAIYAQTGNSTPAPSTTTQDSGSAVVSLANPLGSSAAASSPQVLIGRAISAILGLVGSLALLMFIYGGFLWMTSAGNEKNVSKGRDILMWSTIGLIVIFSSYALVKFVLSDFLGV